MPKMKSHSGLKKRIKISASGKARFKRSGARHRMISKDSAAKRFKRKFGSLDKPFEKMVHKLLPYA